MAYTLAEKLLRQHLVSGELTQGSEIAIRPSQLLLQDALAVTACLQFESMGLDRVKVDPAVCYVDHNTLQVGFENADDHSYLQDFCAKYGLYFSRAGNGICHQLHLERFAAPEALLLGGDSHTPTAGAVGSLAIGAGGLDLAVSMAGAPHYLPMPVIVGVRLTGRLQSWASAKDIALELLRRLTVRGGVDKILEFYGPGVATLSVPERGTIANMGAETGATTSVFPSDRQVYNWLRWQRREECWRRLSADRSACYGEQIEIDLDRLEPLLASPHSPDMVVPVSEMAGIKVDQVCVGSCTNSSYRDLMTVAGMLKGRKVARRVDLVVTPGSRQVLEMIARNGALADMVEAGARVLECTCGPCNGIGQAPASGAVSLRTHNRNYQGRSGTLDAGVYLSSPQVAAVAALMGEIADPRKLGVPPAVRLPSKARVDDGMILRPTAQGKDVKIRLGPNIQPIPGFEPLPERVAGEVVLKAGDDITTDHIIPGGAALLSLRSNIPANVPYLFRRVDPGFPARGQKAGGGMIVAGENYGQGSSREHAALVPRSIGIRAVIAKSFARIHRANLINFGILPLVFQDSPDYEQIHQGQRLALKDAHQLIRSGEGRLTNEATGVSIGVSCRLTAREKEILLAGGLLNHARDRAG